MILPEEGSSISFLQIRNEFHNEGTPNPSTFGTSNSNLMSLGFYRGKYRVNFNFIDYVMINGVNGGNAPISMDDFFGVSANCD